MHFVELNEGEYQIYAGAIAQDNGYRAAVTVSRVKGVPAAPKVAYRDLALDDGRCWAKAEDALLRAVARAQYLIWDAPAQLSC